MGGRRPPVGVDASVRRAEHLGGRRLFPKGGMGEPIDVVQRCPISPARSVPVRLHPIAHALPRGGTHVRPGFVLQLGHLLPVVQFHGLCEHEISALIAAVQDLLGLVRGNRRRGVQRQPEQGRCRNVLAFGGPQPLRHAPVQRVADSIGRNALRADSGAEGQQPQVVQVARAPAGQRLGSLSRATARKAARSRPDRLLPSRRRFIIDSRRWGGPKTDMTFHVNPDRFSGFPLDI